MAGLLVVDTSNLTTPGRCRKYFDCGSSSYIHPCFSLPMPLFRYIDSSHTELLRIGNLDPDSGGTSIDTVYGVMEEIQFAPFSIFPEYLKGGGGHHSGDNGNDNGVPSGDVTLIVSVVETYDDDDSYSTYESFLDNLFSALSNVAGACMDDHDTDPHVSMSRGVKFWSAYTSQQYMEAANLEVAVWQAMYPKGVVIGSSGYAAFPPGRGGTKQKVGYGNLYFFFDRANITKAFAPYRDLTSSESTYATLYSSGGSGDYYASTTTINFDYGGSGDQNGGNWKWNPYSWNQMSAKHDMTDGWELPPNCKQEGETFLGIPLSRSSDSKLTTSTTFQDQFDFENLVDRTGTYITSFGTNHGWLVGEELSNAMGSIVDKDTAHIPIFYTGTTNPNMVRSLDFSLSRMIPSISHLFIESQGGIALGDLIKVVKNINFGTLYIKPAFVFVDSDGHVKLQFEVDTTSALAYLYDNLCKELGITWNGKSPSNSRGVYSNCAMHAAGDRAKYGCGPNGKGTGGFCPQMTLAYAPKFASEDAAAEYLYKCNQYIDSWRSTYPTGVAVGSSNFCSDGGCLALFLNRYDVYEVFKPNLAGSSNVFGKGGQSMPPTVSPAPTWKGGCDDPHNYYLEKCMRRRFPKPQAVAYTWNTLGKVGQVSILLVLFMAVTLSISIFLARARKKRRRNESYAMFFFRDIFRNKRKKKRRKVGKGLQEGMLQDASSRRSKSSGRRSSRSKRRSKSANSRSGRSRGGKSSSSRAVSVQPERSTRSRDRKRGSAENLKDTGSERPSDDPGVDNPGPDESKDNRQQLV